MESAVNATMVAHLTTKGRVYCMNVDETSQANNMIQEDCQISGNIIVKIV